MTGLAAMQWAVAIPEIVLACFALAILLLGVFLKDNAFFVCSMLSIAALFVTAIVVIAAPRGVGYDGLFSSDSFSSFVNLLILVACILGIVASLDYNEHQNLRRFEFPVLIVLCAVGMMVMASATNLMTLYLGLETHSLAQYVLAASARDRLRSAEAGLKYFVLGALASGLLLYGITLVYGFTGSMSFADLAGALSDPGRSSTGLVVGIVFIIAGLAFKVSAVPFHMWTPDVYEGAPTPVTLFLGTAPKVASMALLVRVMAVPFGHLLAEWQQVIILVSIASMLLGSLAAIGQRSIKRLMAYSSIGHMGYTLVGLAAGSAVGVRGVLIYLVTYVFMNAGTFAVVLAMRRRGRMLEQISDLSGLGRTDHGLAMAMAVFMFSMAGIPPFSGFWGKYFIFTAAVHSGLWVLAVIGVLTSVIGAYYYLRVIKVMYFDAAEEAFDPRPASISLVTAGSALFTGLFFLFPAPLLAAADSAARVLFG
jgi:NADH-quinone oxidoreductase subunit N